MRKLLKLVAIGALLAVGPIQAFANNETPNQTYSDEIQIFNSGVPIVNFKFYDTGNSTSEPENSQSEHLLTDSPPTIGTPPTTPNAWNGGAQAYLVTLNNVTNRTDTSFSNYFLNLTGVTGDGSQGNIISDVSDTLWANFKPTNSIGIYSVDIYFFDGPPLVSQVGSMSTSVPEATFDGVATSALGLNGTDFTVLFASDPGVLNAIPEPEIYAMMGIGLALMGFVARRKSELQDRAAT